MPCQLPKKYPWDDKDVASIWERVRGLVNEGKTDQSDIIRQISADLGVKPDAVAQAIIDRPKISKAITNKMWRDQAARRSVEQAASSMVAQMNTPKWVSTAKTIADIPRRIATGQHWTVFSKTHQGDLLFTNPKAYFESFRNNLKLTGEAGRIAHEQRISEMKADPDYDTIVRSGLNTGQDVGSFKGAKSEILGKTAKKGRSDLAFEELGRQRFNIMKDAMKDMPESDKNATNLRTLADVINNEQGSAKIQSTFGKRLASWLLFAPRLLPAKFKASYIDPINAFKTYTNRANATSGQLLAMNYVGRRLATLAKVYTATLAAETAYSYFSGDKRNMPNWGQEGIQGTSWLRPKLFGHGIPVSPTVEMWKIPFQMLAAAHNARPGENRLLAGGEKGLQTLISAASPTVSIASELLTGQQAGTGNVMPKIPYTDRSLSVFPNKPTGTHVQLTYTEMLGAHIPIWASGFVHDVYDSMRAEGVDHPTAKMWIQAAAKTLGSAPTGYHAPTEYESSHDQAMHAAQNDPQYKQHEAEYNADHKGTYADKLVKDAAKAQKEKNQNSPPPKELFGAFN
jgi:hypothetical protein